MIVAWLKELSYTESTAVFFHFLNIAFECHFSPTTLIYIHTYVCMFLRKKGKGDTVIDLTSFHDSIGIGKYLLIKRHFKMCTYNIKYISSSKYVVVQKI